MKNDWNMVDMDKNEFNAEFDEYPEPRFSINIKPEPKIKKNALNQIEAMINRVIDRAELAEKARNVNQKSEMSTKSEVNDNQNVNHLHVKVDKVDKNKDFGGENE